MERDVPFVVSSDEAVDDMLRLASVSRRDVVYDLGSGDGRIVIAAARKYGARGVGIEIDPALIEASERNAREAGVAGRVRFVKGDFFKSDLREATVVTLYLHPVVNLQLRPRLLAELEPGTRLVSNTFHMGEWEPDATSSLPDRQIRLWIIPAKVDGIWRWSGPDRRPHTIWFHQEFQKFSGGSVLESTLEELEVRNGRIKADAIEFELAHDGNLVGRYRGRVSGGTITGIVETAGRSARWSARLDQ